MLEVCPMTLREANAYVEQYHRHQVIASQKRVKTWRTFTRWTMQNDLTRTVTLRRA